MKRALAVGIAAVTVLATMAATGGTANASPGLALVVNSTGDGADAHVGDGICLTAAGTCTLRAAIQEADAQTSAVAINFAISGTGPFTIAPATHLPNLTNPAGISIDGYTQPGAAPNTAQFGSNATLEIQLSGQGPNGFDALEATAGTNTIRGISIYNFKHALWFEGAGTSFNQVIGDFICTNAAGTFRAPAVNGSAGGILIQDGSSHNFVGVSSSYNPANGPPSLADRNIISGCAHRGVIISYINTDYNVVQDNVVGLNPSGTAALPNWSHGVDINYEAQHNLVGGPNPGEGNVISGNIQEGVEVSHGNHNKFNDVIGNFIGTGINGTTAPSYAANGMMGIRLEGEKTCDPCTPNAGYSQVYDNVVVNNAEGMLIDKGQQHNNVYDNWIGELPNGTPAPNKQYGVRIEHGAVFNTIGPDNVIAYNPVGIEMDPTESQPPSSFVLATYDNKVTQNSIHDNTKLGIDLAPYNQANVGATQTNPNVENGIATPVLSSVAANSVSGTACANCTVEVYQADTSSISPTFTLRNYGQGENYLGSATANGSGKWSFTPTTQLAQAEVITADATDSSGDTSEFAKDKAVPIVTALTVAISAHSVPSGGSLTVSGALTQMNNGAPLPNQAIELDRINSDGSHTVVTTGLHTDGSGKYSDTFTPTGSGRYQAIFAKTGSYQGSKSPPSAIVTYNG
jgi:CSLREA domain-containing protein